MVVPGFPVIGVGREIGDVNRDEEGIGRARDAGKNMAWLIRATEMARESSREPAARKSRTKTSQER